MSDDTVLLVREFSSSQRKSLPAGSPLLAPTLQLLAIILDRPGRNPEEARALAREARALFSASRTNGPPLDGAMVAAMDYFAWSKFVAGAPVDGLMMSEQAMELARARYRWNQRGAMQPARTLAWILLSLKRMPEAAAAFEEALRSIRAILGDDHIFAQMDVAGLGAAYRDAGRVAESRRVLEEALTRGERSTSARPYAAILRCELGLTLQRDGRTADAESAFRMALDRYDDPGSHPLSHRLRPRERAMFALGRTLAARGAFAEAESLVVQAFVQLESSYELLAGDRAGLLRESLEAVVETYVASGKPDKAAEWRQRGAASPRGANQ
jgi:tetratricopeptide (TPR) repeat protein